MEKAPKKTTKAEAAPAKAAPKKTATPAAAKGDKPFKVGDKVEGLYDEDGKWYTAIIQRENMDGSYLVAWLEDDNEYTITADNMKMKKSFNGQLEYQAGDVIEGLFAEDETWYSGRIKRVLESGSFTVVWDTDGGEYEITSDNLRRPKPKIPVSQLKTGEKYTGRCGRTFDFGTFVDFGAERDGVIAPGFMYEGDSPKFKENDKVKAIYDEDDLEYVGTIQKANKDGTYLLTWDEDGNEYTCKSDVMTLIRPAELEEGHEVDVWIDKITTGKDGNPRVSLSLVESKVGYKPRRDLSAWRSVGSKEWIKGKVVKIMPFGVFVEVRPPKGGKPAQGLVHVTQIRDGFIENLENEVEVGQEVDVCVKDVDEVNGKLSLSMKGC